MLKIQFGLEDFNGDEGQNVCDDSVLKSGCHTKPIRVFQKSRDRPTVYSFGSFFAIVEQPFSYPSIYRRKLIRQNHGIHYGF